VRRASACRTVAGRTADAETPARADEPVSEIGQLAEASLRVGDGEQFDAIRQESP